MLPDPTDAGADPGTDTVDPDETDAAPAALAATGAQPAPGVPDLQLLRVDAVVEASKVEWAEEIAEAVTWPDPRSEMFSNYLRSLTSEETMSISRFIFMLKAGRIESAEAMEALIDAHNSELEKDIADPDYPARSGMTRGRLKAGIFSERARLDAGLVTARFGAGVMNRLGFKRFLVRLSGKGGWMPQLMSLWMQAFFEFMLDRTTRIS